MERKASLKLTQKAREFRRKTRSQHERTRQRGERKSAIYQQKGGVVRLRKGRWERVGGGGGGGGVGGSAPQRVCKRVVLIMGDQVRSRIIRNVQEDSELGRWR